MKLSKSVIGLSTVIAVLLIIIATMIFKDFSHSNSDADKRTSAVTESTVDKSIDTDIQSEISNYTTAVELDKDYKSRLSKAKSNAEITEINSEFADKWKAEIDTNYQKLLTVADGSFREQLIASQKEWYVNAEKLTEERLAFLIEVYQYGSIVPVKVSEYEYNLYRERAIELFDMYEELKK